MLRRDRLIQGARELAGALGGRAARGTLPVGHSRCRPWCRTAREACTAAQRVGPLSFTTNQDRVNGMSISSTTRWPSGKLGWQPLNVTPPPLLLLGGRCAAMAHRRMCNMVPVCVMARRRALPLLPTSRPRRRPRCPAVFGLMRASRVLHGPLPSMPAGRRTRPCPWPASASAAARCASPAEPRTPRGVPSMAPQLSPPFQADTWLAG